MREADRILPLSINATNADRRQERHEAIPLCYATSPKFIIYSVETILAFNVTPDKQSEPKVCNSSSGRAIPIAGNREVAAITQHEHNIGKAGGVRVRQVEETVAIDPDRVYSVSVPISRHRLVARVPEHE